MPLELKDVHRIAMLARIEITDVEAGAVRDQLNDILNMIGGMQAVDTEGIEPMAHAQDVILRLRDDAVSETDRHAAFQAIAPQVEADLYLVPKVIE
ncbi:MAG: Asp-tRNA(Asn)/Glu-tRNA(Gln) amidotransferase subunit GatC [Burkholderiales bacterium]